jgi:hypothetical protein
VTFVLGRAGAAGSLQLSQGPAKGFDFTFVRQLLALGQFNQFQHFLHLIQGVPE